MRALQWIHYWQHNTTHTHTHTHTLLHIFPFPAAHTHAHTTQTDRQTHTHIHLTSPSLSRSKSFPPLCLKRTSTRASYALHKDALGLQGRDQYNTMAASSGSVSGRAPKRSHLSTGEHTETRDNRFLTMNVPCPASISCEWLLRTRTRASGMTRLV